jgi:predicted chitinase
MLTKPMLKKLWPHAPEAKIDAIVAVAPAVFGAFGITTALRVAHFMAQVSHENGAGTIVHENMNYSAPRLLQIFGVGRHSARITEAEAQMLAHQPQAIAERVYGLGNPKKARELGNTLPGDGWKFRGGGDLQLTGKAKFAWASRLAGVDLVANPDAIGDPRVSFRVAAAEFAALGCLPFADKDNCLMVTRRVNGGSNGLAERQQWLRKWKIALPQLPEAELPDDEPQFAPRGSDTTGLVETIKDSKIAQSGGVVGTGGAAVAFASIGEAADKAAAIKGQTDALGLTDYLLAAAQKPSFWIALAIVAAGALIVYWRWRDHA